MATTSTTPRAVASPTSSPNACDTWRHRTDHERGDADLQQRCRRAGPIAGGAGTPRAPWRRLHGRRHRGSRRSPGQKACATSSSAQAAATARRHVRVEERPTLPGPPGGERGQRPDGAQRLVDDVEREEPRDQQPAVHDHREDGVLQDRRRERHEREVPRGTQIRRLAAQAVERRAPARRRRTGTPSCRDAATR